MHLELVVALAAPLVDSENDEGEKNQLGPATHGPRTGAHDRITAHLGDRAKASLPEPLRRRHVLGLVVRMRHDEFAAIVVVVMVLVVLVLAVLLVVVVAVAQALVMRVMVVVIAAHRVVAEERVEEEILGATLDGP